MTEPDASPRSQEAAAPGPPRRTPLARGRAAAGDRPQLTALAILAVVALLLIITQGLQNWAQVSINGLISGSYFALGAVGLTLVYGILKLVNFAHGDMLTLGAYIAFVFTVSAGLPFIVAVVLAVVATAALGVGFEKTMWGPMRERGAGLLQLLLMAIGLAFIIRNGIQLIWGTQQRTLGVDVTSTYNFIGLRIGQTELYVVLVGFAALVAVGLMLSYTTLGKQMRALADNFDLAETTGINTGRVVLWTWVLAGGLAGFAGVLFAASVGVFTPNLGFFLLLSLFAAVILGGIGNAYGALAGGIVLGLAQEWSTLLIEARWKLAIGFLILILVLMIRPQGIFGSARTV